MKAYILITTKPGTSEEVVKEIKKIPGIVCADSVWGRFDVIAVIEAGSLKSIQETVYRVIPKIPHVIHTETAITL